MDVNSWVGVVAAATVIVGTAWQIWRDLRKDRVDQERRARAAAVREALLEERLRQIEERDRDAD
jgi:ABC-type nickel/cobalt efflux system permease component RcnA